MNNIIYLIKAGYGFKKNIKKCLKHDHDSNEYKIAKYYDDYFKSMEDDHDDGQLRQHIPLIESQIEKARLQGGGSQTLADFYLSMESFLDALKKVVKH